MKKNNYELIRQPRGSHSMWSNGSDIISLPNIQSMHSVVMLRLIKEHNLKV